MPERSSDVIEIHSSNGLGYGIGGILLIAFGGLLHRYKGEGYTIGLVWVLYVGGAACLGYGIYRAWQIRKVARNAVKCVYCNFRNELTEPPTQDITCVSCHRVIPIQDGKVLPVSQVRCGFCNELNYYSEKTEILLCENCNREVPIFHEEGFVPKKLPKGFALQDDDKLYELVLVAPGNKTEELIEVLQRMLALNRKQVKQIIEEAPVTLLTGIPIRKAEMLQAQLTMHDAAAEFRALP